MSGARPPKGPDSFVLTYKIFKTYPPQESMSPYEVHAPPTQNPGSTTAVKYFLRFDPFPLPFTGSFSITFSETMTVVDPGFSEGGRGPRRGAVDP